MIKKTGISVTVAGSALSVLLFLVVFIVMMAGGADKACAQPIAPTPCDTVYYDSLEARAWLEAQREITQNQNLIFKPDSVLEYTCFDRFAGVLALEAINMFSETTRWGPILPPNSMDVALRNLVGGALNDYLRANFQHTYLGGRAAALDTVLPLPPIVGAPYNCNMMDQVWNLSKCMNFVDIPQLDGFFTFENYATTDDKRQLPVACAALGAVWNANIRQAGLDPANPPAWPRDNVQTYLGWMNPANCGILPNYPPIDTGVTVNRSKATPNNYVERVCIIPGCRYQPPAGGGAAMGTCVP